MPKTLQEVQPGDEVAYISRGKVTRATVESVNGKIKKTITVAGLKYRTDGTRIGETAFLPSKIAIITPELNEQIEQQYLQDICHIRLMDLEKTIKSSKTTKSQTLKQILEHLNAVEQLLGEEK